MSTISGTRVITRLVVCAVAVVVSPAVVTGELVVRSFVEEFLVVVKSLVMPGTIVVFVSFLSWLSRVVMVRVQLGDILTKK